jgi:hypothetical protein
MVAPGLKLTFFYENEAMVAPGLYLPDCPYSYHPSVSLTTPYEGGHGCPWSQVNILL